MMINILIAIKQRWRLLFVILIPLILLPLPIINNSPQAKCGYIVLILTTFWISEVIPLPVTSLLPLILFPMTGILKAEVVAESYFEDIIALFIGSLSLAYAIESVNLHRRIALFVLSVVGTSTKWAMGGLMGVTAFLSMWINNSAATSIMLPVALAISDELERHEKGFLNRKQTIKESISTVNETVEIPEIEVINEYAIRTVTVDVIHVEESNKEIPIEVKSRFSLPWIRKQSSDSSKSKETKFNDIKKAFLLGTAYSATIGGLSTLTGSGTNVFVKGFIENTYKNTDFHINYLNFLLFALPVGIIMLILCWIWLQLVYNTKELFQCRTTPESREVRTNLKTMLVRQYKDLGKPNWSEYCVAVIFILMITLWSTREFGEIRGWDILFQEGYLSYSTVAVLCGILPLIVPNSNPFKKNWKYEPIIQWKDLVKNIPWDAVFLLGAGLAVAAAFTSSNLSNSVAETLRFFTGISDSGVIFIIIVISALFTEVTSNISTAAIFLPVLDSIARSSAMHPAFLILPCTLAVSLAFMLPIATPPNAIVFSSGAIRVIDMIKTGVVMNILGFLVIFLAATTWMPKIYGLNDEATELFYGINTTTLATARG